MLFEKEINIENNNDIDLFILQLNKDVKFISNKFKKKRSYSVEMDKEKVTKYLLTNHTYNSQESEKKMERKYSHNCNISNIKTDKKIQKTFLEYSLKYVIGGSGFLNR